MNMTIRKALPSDLDEAVSIAEAYMAETPWPKPISREAISKMLEHVQDRDDLLCLVAEKDDHLIGYVLSHITSMWFSDVLEAQMLGIYVRPEHRGGKLAFVLIKFFEEWARSHYIENIGILVDSGISTEQVSRFFGKMGYQQAGNIYTRSLN